MTATSLLSADNPTEVKQALLYLYSFQTDEEQSSDNIVVRNGMGFNGADAPFCSSIAKQVLWGKELSPKQISAITRILNKYHGQLASGAFRSLDVPEVISAGTKSTERITAGVARIKKEDIKGKGRLGIDEKGGLMFTPNVYPSKQIKDLGFKKWDGQAWHQTVALITQAVINDVTAMFGEIEITDEVKDKLQPKKSVKLSKEVVSSSLFPFQKEAVAHAVQAKRSMLALAPGLGKTASAIFAALQVNAKNVLIISPKSLMRNWRKEIQQWTGAKDDEISTWHRDAMSSPTRWVIANYETVRERPERKKKGQEEVSMIDAILNDEPMPGGKKKKQTVKARAQFLAVNWDAIIVDESVLIKNRKAGRTEAIKHLVTEVKPEYVWLLSASPTTKNMSDLWAQMNILHSKRFSSFWKFTERFCHIEVTQWGWNIVGNLPDATEKFKAENSDMYFARTQDQVLDLPEFIFDTVEIEMGKQQDKNYGEIEDQFWTILDEEGNKLTSPNVLAQIVRLTQLASNPLLVGGKDDSPKWDAVSEMLEFEELPAIVWTAFIETASHMQERLSKKFKVATLTGKTPDKERQQIVDDFQAGKIDVLIAHPGVGKFGFTLTAAHTAIYMERTQSSDDYYQSLHRIRRIGTTSSPHVIHLLSVRANGKRGTFDHVTDELLSGRRQNSLELTTGEIKSILEK